MTDSRKRQGLEGSEALRLVARNISELSLERSLRWEVATGLDRIDCLLFGVLLGGNMANRPYRDASGRWNGLYIAPGLQRPMNASAIARAIGLSYETARRRVRGLIERNIVMSTPKALTLSEPFLQRVWATDVVPTDATALRAMLIRLAGEGYAAAQAVVDRLPLSVPDDVQARMLADFGQRALEPFLEQHGDLISGTVIVGIIVANVRHLTQNPELSQRYAAADEPPPDALRHPIAIRALAREVDLPFETVRRRVAQLAKRGMVVASEEGVVVPSAAIRGKAFTKTNQELMRHFERLLRELLRLNS